MPINTSPSLIDDMPPPANYWGNGGYADQPDIYRPGGISLIPSGGLGGFYPTYPGMQFGSGGGGSVGSPTVELNPNYGNQYGSFGSPGSPTDFIRPSPTYTPTLPGLQPPPTTYPSAWTGGGSNPANSHPTFNPAVGGFDSNGQWHDAPGQNFSAASWLSAHNSGDPNRLSTGTTDAGPTRFQVTAGGTTHYIDDMGIIRLSTPENHALYPPAGHSGAMAPSSNITQVSSGGPNPSPFTAPSTTFGSNPVVPINSSQGRAPGWAGYVASRPQLQNPLGGAGKPGLAP